MRTLKEQLNVFGIARHGGASEGVAKRRAVKPGSAEWMNLERPGSQVRVVGFISLSSGLLERWSK